VNPDGAAALLAPVLTGTPSPPRAGAGGFDDRHDGGECRAAPRALRRRAPSVRAARQGRRAARRTVGLEQLIGCRPELPGEQLAAGFGMGHRGTAVAGPAGDLRLDKSRCFAQSGQLLAQGEPHRHQSGWMFF
jgi:hypothetical protein